MSLHSSTYEYTLSPAKVAETAAAKGKKTLAVDSDDEDDGDDVLPIGEPSESTSRQPGDVSALPPATNQQHQEESAMPPTFTPSIKKTLNKMGKDKTFVPPPLPTGLTASTIKSRLDTKKKIK